MSFPSPSDRTCDDIARHRISATHGAPRALLALMATQNPLNPQSRSLVELLCASPSVASTSSPG